MTEFFSSSFLKVIRDFNDVTMVTFFVYNMDDYKVILLEFSLMHKTGAGKLTHTEVGYRPCWIDTHVQCSISEMHTHLTLLAMNSHARPTHLLTDISRYKYIYCHCSKQRNVLYMLTCKMRMCGK